MPAEITTYLHFDIDTVMLPNTAPGTSEGDKLQDFIDKYEDVYLKSILGVALAALLDAGIGDGSIYDAIKNGANYTDMQNITQRWEGFTAGKNPIANFIYWNYQRSNVTSTLGIGVRKPKADNADDASPIMKMVDAWNEMVIYNWKLHGYLVANRASYPTYIGLTYPPEFRYRNAPPNKEFFVTQNPYF